MKRIKYRIAILWEEKHRTEQFEVVWIQTRAERRASLPGEAVLKDLHEWRLLRLWGLHRLWPGAKHGHQKCEWMWWEVGVGNIHVGKICRNRSGILGVSSKFFSGNCPWAPKAKNSVSFSSLLSASVLQKNFKKFLENTYYKKLHIDFEFLLDSKRLIFFLKSTFSPWTSEISLFLLLLFGTYTFLWYTRSLARDLVSFTSLSLHKYHGAWSGPGANAYSYRGWGASAILPRADL